MLNYIKKHTKVQHSLYIADAIQEKEKKKQTDKQNIHRLNEWKENYSE